MKLFNADAIVRRSKDAALFPDLHWMSFSMIGINLRQ